MGCFTILLSSIRKSREQRKPKHGGNAESQSQSMELTPSFRSKMESIPPIRTRPRPLSAPLTLDAAEPDAMTSTEIVVQGNSKRRATSMLENHYPRPQPLPLPAPPQKATSGSHNSRMSTNPFHAYGSLENEEQEWFKRGGAPLMKGKGLCPQPLPLPYPPQGSDSVNAIGSSNQGTAMGPARYYRYKEIAAACNNFSSNRLMAEFISSTMFMASFADEVSSSRMVEATVTCLHRSNQDLREFMNDVFTLSSLNHPNICKLLGFHASNDAQQKMLVYERLPYGSLEHLLFRSHGTSIDWNIRIKIAICAAQGLAFLHEEGPSMAMYADFSTANIQIDRDFNAKLSGYGCVAHIPEGEFSSQSPATKNLSWETLKKGVVTPRSNVWSFGVVLLELLTGRKHYGNNIPKRERNLVRWCRPYLADDVHLVTIIDPHLKGIYPPRATKTLADIAQRCLKKDPSERPNMRTVVECLRMIQDMSCGWYPLQGAAPPMSRLSSSSLDGNFIQPPRWSVVLPTLATRSTGFSTGEITMQDSRELSSEMSRG